MYCHLKHRKIRKLPRKNLILRTSAFWALYGANDRSPRIRANTGEFARIRREFARVRRLFANFLFPRTLANDWRTLGELPRTLAEFARIRPNSRGVRRELANSLYNDAVPTRRNARKLFSPRGYSLTRFAYTQNLGVCNLIGCCARHL